MRYGTGRTRTQVENRIYSHAIGSLAGVVVAATGGIAAGLVLPTAIAVVFVAWIPALLLWWPAYLVYTGSGRVEWCDSCSTITIDRDGGEHECWT